MAVLRDGFSDPDPWLYLALGGGLYLRLTNTCGGERSAGSAYRPSDGDDISASAIPFDEL